MKIPVKDFTIIPVLCPLNLKNCAPCMYAKTSNVHNYPLVSGPVNFGFVECSYIESFHQMLEEATRKEGIQF